MRKNFVFPPILSSGETGRNNRAKIAGTIVLLCLSPVLAVTLPHPALAQTKFVTAAQIKPILTATKGNWIALREYGEQDLLYFTHLLSWRCGLTQISYSLNDEETFNVWPLGICDEDLPNPNVLAEDQKIYTGFPLGSVQSVTVRITYDDETTDENRYERKSVMIP
ncbi:hypothetical protein [Neptunicoccus cionae]|uniref:hypothetical protein n=1 Tax=Neptunicoccus cionae TaxID=2035344 RepID=UPI000C785A68|nr:hypothetical protein [Amylibacter cionae]PLS22013.1 hypothetical protein C0U40_06125 [Amylibacter cionae]